VRRLVAAVFGERKPTRCGFARAASKSANKLAHSQRCCDRQTRTFTPYVSCPQCAKQIRQIENLYYAKQMFIPIEGGDPDWVPSDYCFRA